MSDSSDKKPPKRRSSFDADLDAMLDEAELSLSPINDLLDEDAIDRLLVDDGFDSEDDELHTDNRKHEPTLENKVTSEAELNLETEPDDFLEDFVAEQAKPVVDDIDLRLDEATAELELPTNLAEMNMDLANELFPDTEEDSPIIELPAEKLAKTVNATDDLDLKLQQASADLGLIDNNEAEQLQAVVPDNTDSSIERLEQVLADDDHLEPLSDSDSELPKHEVDLESDILSELLDQKAEFASELVGEYEQPQHTDTVHEASANTSKDATLVEQAATIAASDKVLSEEGEIAVQELGDQLNDEQDLSVETPESAEEVLAFGSFANDDWHAAEQTVPVGHEQAEDFIAEEVEKDLSGPESTSNDLPEELQATVDESAPDEAGIDLVETENITDKLLNEPLTDDLISPVDDKTMLDTTDNVELIDEFADELAGAETDNLIEEVLASAAVAEADSIAEDDDSVEPENIIDDLQNETLADVDELVASVDDETMHDKTDDTEAVDEFADDLVAIDTDDLNQTEDAEAMLDTVDEVARIDEFSDEFTKVDTGDLGQPEETTDALLSEPLTEDDLISTVEMDALQDLTDDATPVDELTNDFEEDAESALAKQIDADLLADNDLISDDITLPTEAILSEIDELSGLEVIQDEFVDSPAEETETDEFSDDDLFSSLNMSVMADLDNDTTDQQAELLISEPAADPPLSDDDFLMADFDISADEDNLQSPDDFSANPYGDDAPILDEPSVSEQAEDKFASVDFDDELLIESTEDKPSIDEAALAIAALAEFKAEQESFNKQQKKLISDLEQKTKKSSIFTYTALGFGVLALSVAGFLGYVAHSAKNEAARLNEVIVGLEKKLTEAPTKPPESEAVDAEAADEEASTEEATTESENEHTEQATETKQTQQHGKTELAAPVNEKELEHKAEAEDKAPKAEPDEHADKTATAKPETKPDTGKKNVKEATNADGVEDKAAQEDKVVVPKKKIVFIEEKTAAKETADKPVESVVSKPAAEPAKKAASVRQKEKPLAKKKPVKTDKTETASEKKEPPVIKKLQANGDWSVNLLAFKQDWYAKGKANEFRQKGIPVDIVPVQIDNVTWYRIRVTGFNGRADANVYAERVKKALNLSSVWVGK